MQLICPSWSTTTVLGQRSPAAHAWCCVKAASAWVQTATSWGRGTTCCAPSPPSRPPAPQQAASTTDQNAHRANQTATGWSGWSAFTATTREQHSAAWASQPAAGAAAAAPSWNQEFSAPNEIRETMWEYLWLKDAVLRKRLVTKINAKSEKQLTCTRWVNTTMKTIGATNHSFETNASHTNIYRQGL